MGTVQSAETPSGSGSSASVGLLRSVSGFGVASIQYRQHLCLVKGFFEHRIALVEIVYCIDATPLYRDLKTASGLSRRIQVVHIKQENTQGDFASEWHGHFRASIKEAGWPEPELVILESPYRKVVSPILEHIWKMERENCDKTIMVLIPQLVETHWYHRFLHNQRETILLHELLCKGENRIVIVSVPWRIEKDATGRKGSSFLRLGQSDRHC